MDGTPLPDELFTSWAKILSGDGFKLLAYIAYHTRRNRGEGFTIPVATLAQELDLTIGRLGAVLWEVQCTGTIRVARPGQGIDAPLHLAFVEEGARTWDWDTEEPAPTPASNPARLNPIYARDGYTCQYCGTTEAADYHIDHVVPRSQGGPSARYNLVVACQSCNLRKKDRTWIPNNLAVLTERFPEWAARIEREAVPHD